MVVLPLPWGPTMTVGDDQTGRDRIGVRTLQQPFDERIRRLSASREPEQRQAPAGGITKALRELRRVEALGARIGRQVLRQALMDEADVCAAQDAQPAGDQLAAQHPDPAELGEVGEPGLPLRPDPLPGDLDQPDVAAVDLGAGERDQQRI
ncbi:hypothetical protein [Cryptosporangium minutisporangium]|uniref:Uncharacterized protein n=1 Tax=Cryptosporangium minutisporangium TaxID=113569 RepID=A0ABP6SQ08_9ACTN